MIIVQMIYKNKKKTYNVLIYESISMLSQMGVLL